MTNCNQRGSWNRCIGFLQDIDAVIAIIRDEVTDTELHQQTSFRKVMEQLKQATRHAIAILVKLEECGAQEPAGNEVPIWLSASEEEAKFPQAMESHLCKTVGGIPAGTTVSITQRRLTPSGTEVFCKLKTGGASWVNAESVEGQQDRVSKTQLRMQETQTESNKDARRYRATSAPVSEGIEYEPNHEQPKFAPSTFRSQIVIVDRLEKMEKDARRQAMMEASNWNFGMNIPLPYDNVRTASWAIAATKQNAVAAVV